MNFEKALNLAVEVQSGANVRSIDALVDMLKDEIRANIAKQTGKKDMHKLVMQYIKHIHSMYGGSREFLEYLYYSNTTQKYYLTDAYSAIEFSDLDIEDLPVAKDNAHDFSSIVESISQKADTIVPMPSKSEILTSYKLQKAEHNSDPDYYIYIKIGESYYDPDQLYKLLSLMGNSIVAKQNSSKKDSELSLVDENGNRAVLMNLVSSGIRIRTE